MKSFRVCYVRFPWQGKSRVKTNKSCVQIIMIVSLHLNVCFCCLIAIFLKNCETMLNWLSTQMCCSGDHAVGRNATLQCIDSAKNNPSSLDSPSMHWSNNVKIYLHKVQSNAMQWDAMRCTAFCPDHWPCLINKNWQKKVHLLHSDLKLHWPKEYCWCFRSVEHFLPNNQSWCKDKWAIFVSLVCWFRNVLFPSLSH